MADSSVGNVFKIMIILGFCLLCGSLYFQSARLTMSVLAGVIIAVVNLWLIQRAVGGLLAGHRSKISGLYAFKIAALLGVLAVLINFAGLDPIGLLAGLSVLVVASVTGGMGVAQSADDEEASVEGDN